jgi:peptidyl-prolyl cis-trans isomerase D
MMHMLRKAAVAVLFAILIGAFAISMGGNNYFDRQTRQTVAKVGSVEITPQQFQRAYERTLENLSARAGRRISAPEAQALGLPDRVLQGLIQDAAVDLEATRLRLGLSREGLRQSIMTNEFFQDSKGTFSPEKYQQFLQQIGYSAPVFEQEFRGELIRKQVRGIFEKSGVVPEILLEAFNNYTNEQRTLVYFTLNADAAGTIDPPSEDALRAFYEGRKTQFMAPELRKVAVVAISPEAVASKISISDDELKAEYAAKAANYAVPERRKIEVIPFEHAKAAEAAYAALKGGKDFLDVAKEAGFAQPDLDLGLVSKKEFGEKFPANEAVVNAAFSLAKGQISQPVDGPVSTVIIRVLEIIPGEEKSFDDVKNQMRGDLIKARSTADAAKLIKAFEEDRAAGAPLADTAKKLNLALDEVTLDRTGKGADGKPVTLSAVPAGELAAAAFKSDIGVENEALRLGGSGYAWFEVQDIVKARQKPLDEVKADVEAAWHNDHVRAKLTEKARDLTARLDRGEPIAEVAKSVGAEVKTTQPLKRGGAEEGLPAAASTQAFSLSEGSASSALAGDVTSRVVFQVEKIMPPQPLDEAGKKALEQRLQNQISTDNFTEYLSEVIKSAGVSVDRKNFAAVAGGTFDGDE